MIAWDQCINGLDMGIYHNTSSLFLCPFTIIFEYFRILISFLSKMAMQLLSHSFPTEIRKFLCSPLKMCAFFAWMNRLPDNGMLLVFLEFIFALFANHTVVPLWVYFMYNSNLMSSVYQ